MNNVLDAIPPEHRTVIVEELTRLNPDMLAELRETQEPTNEQSDAVVDTLIRAMSENFGPGHIPNERGKAIDNAIGAYLLAWPIYR
ncbi:hypothetical protein MSM1_16620 [Mycobacterium sp. SM1]|uniref:hypothetical protein n=1 Tax=Mycobacterium sp. SM1 TaxID=2816243 RepID=UPI001BCACC99|nr:hypothetical protein [Mycobacterium sp. SM1]MBS4729896.1 hypothetical protein [Mycobacterium sp. SM1]